eukprot:756657-Rhodomonas_salina.1
MVFQTHAGRPRLGTQGEVPNHGGLTLGLLVQRRRVGIVDAHAELVVNGVQGLALPYKFLELRQQPGLVAR